MIRVPDPGEFYPDQIRYLRKNLIRLRASSKTGSGSDLREEKNRIHSAIL